MMVVSGRYLEAGQLLPLGREEEGETAASSGQGEAPHQQGQHHHVGEDGSEVGYLEIEGVWGLE